MTRTQAWRKVAEAYGTPRRRRTRKQELIAEYGLCAALCTAHGLPIGSDEATTIYDLVTPLSCQLFGESWPPREGKEGDAFRATFAGLMAAMTQRERNRLVEGL